MDSDNNASNMTSSGVMFFTFSSGVDRASIGQNQMIDF